MAYETITVRMNRSSDTIPWGFTISNDVSMPILISSAPNIFMAQQVDLITSAVQKESLADKAGLKVGDEITKLCGRDIKDISPQEAKNIIQRSSFEVQMLLKRHVTEHSCLPWQLTEKNNQITVDYIKPATAHERKNITHGTSTYTVPITKESSKFRLSSYNQHQESSISRPHNLGYQPAPFTNVTNTEIPHSGKMHQKESYQNSYITDSYTRTETSSHANSSGDKPISGSVHNVPVSIVSSNSSLTAPISPLVGIPSGGAQTWTKNYQTPVHVETSNAYNDSGYNSFGFGDGSNRSMGTTPKTPRQDTRVSFQHSPRTERHLSPHAAIRHLQYNSPMSLYSSQSAAEQYRQQTGGLFGTDQHMQQPKGDEAYLRSETRRLIAEEEGHGIREKSPATQSASFKRISRACGTPVD